MCVPKVGGPHQDPFHQGPHGDWGLPAMNFSLEISMTSVFPKGHMFTVGKF